MSESLNPALSRYNKNYGSIRNKKLNGYTRTIDQIVSHESDDELERTNQRLYASDRFINYKRSSESENENEHNENDPENVTFALTSTEIFISQTVFKHSYIIEPVAFIQNLASSIMGISLSQFIYNRIFTRLLNEANHGQNGTNFTLPVLFSNGSSGNNCSPSSSNSTHKIQLLANLFDRLSLASLYASQKEALSSNLFNLYHDPIDYDQIRLQAQEQTAHLYFISSLFAGIPVILMTNLLGVNCSNLGRKTLMLIYLFAMTVKFILILFQCVYPEWPDWLFYAGAFIEGVSGGGGVFYLALYCYISDLTSPSSRSYRITFLNNTNSMASLCVTFLCGYIIKYYGYFYLFLASVVLIFSAFVYTAVLVPEPLVELKGKSFRERLKSCSAKRSLNCFKVYFSKRETRRYDDNENEPLLSEQPSSRSKQTFVLLLIVFANFVYNFGTIGIGSIFTLFIMNAPFCFDSIDISNFSVFSTVLSLVVSLFVSKFIKVSDLLICIVSVASFFGSVFCYIYGGNSFYVYLGAGISSLAGLEYGYVRSIISKSVDKKEVADALSLILIVDTVIAVVSSIVFPIFYSKTVSKGIGLLFGFSNGFILIALICHV
jgi:Mg2+ and Co2+ transporter CorA